jgi:hypothetical protein
MTSNKDSEKSHGPASPAASSRPQGRTIDLKAAEVGSKADLEKSKPVAEAMSAEKAADAARGATAQPAPQSGAGGTKEPPSDSVRAAPARGGFSFGTARIRVWALAAMAALVGAVVALAANALISGPSDSGEAQRIAALQSSLREVSARLESSRQESTQAREQLQLRLTELGGALETLGGRLDKAEGDLGAAATDQKALSQAQQRLSELEKALSALRIPSGEADGTTIDVGATVAELADMNRRLGALEAGRGTTGAAATDDGAADARIDEMDKTASANRDALAALQERIATLQQAQDVQSQRLETVVKEEAEQIATGERLARRLAAEALRTSYIRGAAFSGLLETAQQLSGTGPAPEALRRFADGGVATTGMLIEQFDAVSDDIIDADRPPTDGVGDWLMQSARSLVTVRPVGPVEGETAEAIVSRIDDALEKGSFQAALTEWQSLSAPARAVSQNFADALDARTKADAALAQLTAALEGNGS